MKTVSIKQILARIIRTARDVEPDYYSNIQEWIAEALAIAYTPTTLEITSSVLDVKNHIADMPCGFHKIICMEYCGYRLLEAGDITAFHQGDTTEIRKGVQPPNPTVVYDSLTLKPFSIDEILQLPPVDREYYREGVNVFQFSFKEGTPKVHYYSLPIDSEGFPLIPDNANLHNHIFYYTLMSMIGAGIPMNSKELTYMNCRQLTEDIYLPRAINELKRWDSEIAHKNYPRMVFPQYFHKDFFKNGEQYQKVVGI